MINILKDIYGFILAVFKLYKIPSYYWCKLIHRNDIPLSKVQYKKGNKLYLQELDFSLSSNDNQIFLLQQYSLAKRLMEEHDVKFINYKQGEVLVEFENDIKIVVKTYADFFILEEIFNNGVYNLLSEKEFIAWDIGCNIGIASLFLAHKENVRKIYAFEPFKETFDEAKKNFDLNPRLAQKIILQNAGIGSKVKEIELEYSSEFKGNVGIMGLNKNLKVKNGVVIEKIKLLSASQVMAGMLEQSNLLPVVVKMDCEGSEYDIVRELAENNLLKKIFALMIEWHFKGPLELEKYLGANGFTTFSLSPFNNNSGFIYSVNTNRD